MKGESVGAIGAAGAVNVIYGATNGLASSGNQLWQQNTLGGAGSAADGDGFGAALAP